MNLTLAVQIIDDYLLNGIPLKLVFEFNANDEGMMVVDYCVTRHDTTIDSDVEIESFENALIAIGENFQPDHG